MRTSGVAQLKAKLSQYLQAVKAGEEVIVTEHGKAIARVVPYTRSGATPAEYEDMIRAGLIRPGQHNLGPEFADEPRPADPGDFLLKAILEEREQGY